ncbi:hypothetical protein QBC40DRAFT_271719 [Triangularia verruculosa]|uniref:DUF7730 domain-containing protein n=1 Tax=Triangularia verruculosa TaxID=2587418 RepID=A0AAN6XRA8_9PEZI|nr:hypothetical protein QBC40DRAFT_271719 [Triangularia verruculosa]
MTDNELMSLRLLLIATPSAPSQNNVTPHLQLHYHRHPSPRSSVLPHRAMQMNKSRQRKIQNQLHKSLPDAGSHESDLWNQNTRSPLLQLPPELRNRIYELVLSVGQIQVIFKKYQFRAISNGTNNNTHRPQYETLPGGFSCLILDREEHPWPNTLPHRITPVLEQGTSARNNRRKGMTLLSPVCRQLYHETVLLPYRLNAWSFKSISVMDRFLIKERRLPKSHRGAIRVLYNQYVLTGALEKLFGGLEVMLLPNGVRMTKRVVEVDGDHGGKKVVYWDISKKWWE